jgi:glucose/mannose-6-phosphate isomerase
MSEKALLDDVKALKAIDRSGMAEMIASLPIAMSGLMLEKGPEPEAGKDITNIVFAGMGGSAIGGDIIRSWLGSRLKLPIGVNRGYGIPSFAGKDTLFVAVSFSGNTEETLSAFESAMARGCRVVALSSGGMLEAKARELGAVHQRVKAPEGMVPRAALGHLLVPMAQLLQNAGLVDYGKDLEETVAVLGRLAEVLRPSVEWEANEAKGIATKLHGTIPVVHGTGILEVAAMRWKTQLNENSKVMAWADHLPEMDHNSIVGWDGDPTAGNHSCVILRDPRVEAIDHRIRDRIEATKEAAWHNAGRIIEVSSEGDGALARIMSSIYKGDYASLYLAVLRRVDPTPVDVIEALKERLRKA